jgi:demethylmenaquinone methyltransferase/2-methoxy-6-polyprenyl-1,4-benzoquinol methylase
MKNTDFGFQEVPEDEKARRVAGVFDSVARRYDLMNDLMSAGLHRYWKRFTVEQSLVRPGDRVGDTGAVVLTDINGSMLSIGRDRLADHGIVAPVALCDGERLPFPAETFDCVSVGFGLRNMTHKEAALAEMCRVLRPGGRLLVLEFSRVWRPLSRLYDVYSFQVLPRLGRAIAGDPQSYRYLAESIRMHPDQETLKQMMLEAGFDAVDYFNLGAGLTALHRGVKY